MARRRKKFTPKDELTYVYEGEEYDDFSSGFYRQPTVAEQRQRSEKAAARLQKTILTLENL